MKLAGYANGEWHSASNSGKVLSNAVTGEEIAEISSDGHDFTMLVDYACCVGGPALRKHALHRRARHSGILPSSEAKQSLRSGFHPPDWCPCTSSSQ